MNTRTSAMSLSAIACAAALAACSSAGVDGPIGQTQAAIDGDPGEGAHLFDHALPGTNGRSCATCHVESEAFALSPQHVQALYESNPNDPLFNIIDADNPTAATPTFNHLQAGLVRVNVPLAGNLDIIDANGNVITNADRTVAVWRGVPTTQNTSYTAPYQYDGRAETLEIQADGALHAHSQIDHEPSPDTLEDIADFERTLYTDPAAAVVADFVDAGLTPPDLLPHFPPGTELGAGEVLFKNICAQCHGTGTVNVMNAAVRAQAFGLLDAQGAITVGTTLPDGVSLPTQYNLTLGPRNEFNIGISALSMLEQLGALPNPSGLDFPQIRVRFYTDGTRTTKLVDMPPAPPLVSPSFLPQPFSVDPGRALISGDINDWEAFDIPQLRGIAKTAPYFHDASAPDLTTVVDLYSRFILSAFPVLNLPDVLPPEGPGLPPESLSPIEKKQLLAYLQQL